jgi:hypothetical protein
MAFCLPCFHKLVNIRTKTHSNNHVSDHYNFDQLLKQIMVRVFKTDFRGVNDPAKTISAWALPPLNSNSVDFLGEYKAICKSALGRESGPMWG